MAQFQLFKDKKREWRWRLRANNNKIIASSGESYHNKKDCLHGIDLVKNLSPGSEIRVYTSSKDYFIHTSKATQKKTKKTKDKPVRKKTQIAKNITPKPKKVKPVRKKAQAVENKTQKPKDISPPIEPEITPPPVIPDLTDIEKPTDQVTEIEKEELQEFVESEELTNEEIKIEEDKPQELIEDIPQAAESTPLTTETQIPAVPLESIEQKETLEEKTKNEEISPESKPDTPETETQIPVTPSESFDQEETLDEEINIEEISQEFEPDISTIDTPEFPLTESGSKIKTRTLFGAIGLISIIALLYLFIGSDNDPEPEITTAEISTDQTQTLEKTNEPTNATLEKTKESDVKVVENIVTKEKGISEKIHIVQSGENLWNLAKKYYSDPYLWPIIYHANASILENPDLLVPGIELSIPGLEGTYSNLSKTDTKNTALGYIQAYKTYKERGKEDAKFYLLAANKYDSSVLGRLESEIDNKDLEFARNFDI